MGIEHLVIGVRDDDLVAVFAEDGDVRLVAEVDDLFVAAVANEDRHATWIAVGNEVDRPLDRGEIAAPVGRDDDARGGCRRCLSLRGEDPARGAADSLEACLLYTSDA